MEAKRDLGDILRQIVPLQHYIKSHIELPSTYEK
jgi:hypothetical protein